MWIKEWRGFRAVRDFADNIFENNVYTILNAARTVDDSIKNYKLNKKIKTSELDKKTKTSKDASKQQTSSQTPYNRTTVLSESVPLIETVVPKQDFLTDFDDKYRNWLNELTKNSPVMNNIVNLSRPITVSSEPPILERQTLQTPPEREELNRAGVRSLLREYGYNPYSFKGSLRKALRKYLNGDSSQDISWIDKNSNLYKEHIANRFGPFVIFLKKGGTIELFRKGGKKKDPIVMQLQLQLYDLGAFGDIDLKRAVDGISGKMTKAAITKAQEMGYKVDINKGIVEKGFRIKDMFRNPISVNTTPDGLKTTFNKVSNLSKQGFDNLVEGTHNIGNFVSDSTLKVLLFINDKNKEQLIKLQYGPSVNPGENCGEEGCAAWANKSLKNYSNKYTDKEVGGHAWTRLTAGEHPIMIYSGYDSEDYDRNSFSNKASDSRNFKAADKLSKEFNFDSLDKNKVYMVNMYYKGSPAREQAWKESDKGITGTHTGNLYYDNVTNKWKVAHGIHGILYDDYADDLLGSNHKYGLTAIAEPYLGDIEGFVNYVKQYLPKIIKSLQGSKLPNVLPEVTVTAIDPNKHTQLIQKGLSNTEKALINSRYKALNIKPYIKTLNNARNYYMLYRGLNDKEYADLSKFALNITGSESNGGNSSPLFKRTYVYPDWVRHVGKIIRRGKDSANSRGLSQIKFNDDMKVPELNTRYSSWGLTDDKVKYDPSSMALATLERTLWIQDLLKKKYGNNPIHYTDGTVIPQDEAQAMYWNYGRLTDYANGNPRTDDTTGAQQYVKVFANTKFIK